jgi:hypothetical protein
LFDTQKEGKRDYDEVGKKKEDVVMKKFSAVNKDMAVDEEMPLINTCAPVEVPQKAMKVV